MEHYTALVETMSPIYRSVHSPQSCCLMTALLPSAAYLPPVTFPVRPILTAADSSQRCSVQHNTSFYHWTLKSPCLCRNSVNVPSTSSSPARLYADVYLQVYPLYPPYLPVPGCHARVDVAASCGHGHGGSVGSVDQWRALRSFSSHANIFTNSLQNVEIILLVDTARCGAEKTLNLF